MQETLCSFVSAYILQSLQDHFNNVHRMKKTFNSTNLTLKIKTGVM